MWGERYMNKKKIRNSNYELMRIISMFLIILYHVIYHGQVIQNCYNEGAKIILELLEFLTLVHVNSFVLVTGYFQSTSNFKQSKLWSILNASIFYRILIMLILLFGGVIILDKLTIIKEAFPININEYWFIKCYILLYCLSPFINKGLKNFDKRSFQKLLIAMFVIFSLLPLMTGRSFFENNGFSLYQFIYMYIIGAYLRRYPLDKNYIFKAMSKRMYQLVLIFVFFGSLFLNYIFSKYALSIIGINSILDEISSYITEASILYNNPFVVIQTIAYFAFFATLSINSKIINKIATLTIGVYLIHDNNFVRALIYDALKINNGPIYSYKFIIYVIIISVVIYIFCLVIEWLRQLLFRFIYKLKISYKIREKYYRFINSIHFIKIEESKEEV